MLFEDLLIETLKYQDQLMQIESAFFTKLVQTGMLRSYVAFWGTWSVAESFLTGIEKSVQQYYKDSLSAPENIRTQLEKAKKTVSQHIKTFEQSVNEQEWF